MTILIAPDKFKNCLTAPEAAALIAEGIRDAAPSLRLHLQPIADGGEGTAEIIRAARGGHWIETPAHDALGRPALGRYVWIESDQLAIIEMSQIAGLASLDPASLDPSRATTYGVGELLFHALQSGPRRLFVCLGGSATNDAGLGLATALGWRCLPAPAHSPWPEPRSFLQLNQLLPPPNPAWPEITGACDVNAPLLGPTGATHVFAPQKGASPAMVAHLEACLLHVANLASAATGRDHRATPGAGAAGGLGFGLMTFANAQLTPGFPWVADVLNLDAAIQAADLVLTGEGCLDAQTLTGKGPAGVAALARRHRKPVIALAGRVHPEAALSNLFDQCHALAPDDVPDNIALHEAPARLRAAARAAITAFLA